MCSRKRAPYAVVPWLTSAKSWQTKQKYFGKTISHSVPHPCCVSSIRARKNFVKANSTKHYTASSTLLSPNANVKLAGLRANVVAPGFVTTDMTAALPEARQKEILGQVPLGRYAEADEIAGVVRFLASDAGGYITGAVVPVDGGLGMGH